MRRNRLIPLLLCLGLLLSLCACAAPAERAAGADQIARAAVESQPDGEGLAPLTGTELTDYLTAVCGVEEELWTDAAVYIASGVDAREIIVLRLRETGGEDAAVQALEAHRKARLGDFYGYAPEEAALLEEAAVAAGGGYAVLLVCEDQEAAQAALSGLLSGETELPAEDAPAGEVLNPELDTSAFKPFDPPNEFDMTLYDTAPILAAWESGEEDGLSEKDAAILEVCREIFAECVTEGMTDFEKELALHDALLRRGSYDTTTYDPATPLGRAGNTDPYGFLVGGYGICLGYAASFQLLMDLAEVECITVIGASSDSTSDHAWNMVRLEGEWYCVDPTWNDPSAWEDVPEAEWDWCHHRYFNVTSDYLRHTNHQWDYANVPETAADRFFWDGTGPLPE